MNFRTRLLDSPKRLPVIVRLAPLLLPLVGALPLWLLGRGSAVGEFLAPIAMVLAGLPMFVLIVLAMPPRDRRSYLKGISMALRAFGIVLGVVGLLAGWAGLGARQDGLEANPAGGFGAVLAGMILFGQTKWLDGWVRSPNDQEQA